ncbi:YczE/YyaS/YitT family protein [Tepidibacter formicigenes]|jgi:uncharacterized membrane protein YczE|uniref:Uncharacterized membrane protein YczE n=1 Tax=Tepidibacter formicigenes DSM 15518 TaxID=1123349 RepID=A0A1M6NB05_9FIRM|nr:hypothetical protein [Tepidibacter formicigenes]SHJ92837.1 Uncharacterized membrane protein YczE [Tepidibacter formicigenes DSM 15518]
MKYVKIVSNLIFGLLLCAIGIVLEVNANIGVGPWDAFHIGIIKHIPITLGMIQIITGFSILIFTTLMGEIPGWGTIVNMILIGVFIDIINKSQIIPQSSNFISGLIMLILSLFFMAIGIYFYMKVQLGTGPRDGLMVVFVKKTGKSVRFIRNIIEGFALIVGIILGAPVGIGTVIYALGIGYAVQWIFELLKFDVSKIVHRSILDDYKYIKNISVLKKIGEENNS